MMNIKVPGLDDTAERLIFDEEDRYFFNKFIAEMGVIIGKSQPIKLRL